MKVKISSVLFDEDRGNVDVDGFLKANVDSFRSTFGLTIISISFAKVDERFVNDVELSLFLNRGVELGKVSLLSQEVYAEDTRLELA